MTYPTYTNFVAPAIDAGNLNDVNNVVYNMLGTGGNPPLSTLEIRNNTGTTAAIAAGDAATLASAQTFATNADTALAATMTGRLINIQTLTTSGNYTPTAGTNSIVFFLTGGGGGGGGAAATAAGQNSCGGGGSAGATSIHRATSGFSGQPFVIGAAGTVTAGATGGTGGASTFLGVSAPGGAGGLSGGASASATIGPPAPGVSIGTGANILNGSTVIGQAGTVLVINAAGNGGAGGSSYHGGGGSGGNVSAGNAATGRGSGGGGAFIIQSSAAVPGGVPLAGALIVYEYS